MKNSPFNTILLDKSKIALFMQGTSPGKSAALTMIELENGIVRLRKVRDDIPFDLIREKVITKAKEIFETRPDNITYRDIFKALLEGLCNKACAGEPMPWELKQTIQ